MNFIFSDQIFSAKLVFLVLALLLQPGEVAAGNMAPARFTSTTGHLDLSPYLEILPDPDNSLTVEDLASGENKHAFQAISVTGNNFGFTKTAWWVRFSLRTDAPLNDSLLLQLDHPLLDEVKLYVPNGQNGFDERVTGESLPFSSREISFRTFLFHLPEHQGQTLRYYLRLKSEGTLVIPLSLWSSSAFIEHMDGANFILGGYYGVMLILMLAALASFIKVRDRLFLFYALYLLSYLLLQLSLNGFSFQYFWPGMPWFSSRATAGAVGFVVICGLLFSGRFLDVWNKHPRIKWLFYAVMSLAIAGMLMSLFGNYVQGVKLSTVSGVLLPPVVLIAAIRSVLTGYKPARYFLAAWSIFLAGVFIAGLFFLGYMPHSFFTLYSMQIGSTIEIMLLGYALMDRIEALRKEKSEAILKANEYLNQLNEGLESLVEERTRELSKKNKMLTELALRDSMTGLFNHNASIDYLDRMLHAAKRYDHDLSVIMLDIDFFKKMNDTHGHPAGDKVITAIASLLTTTIRKTDGAGRYGGEEFILVLPESNAAGAAELAERIRISIEQLKIPEIDNNQVTASFGISSWDPENPDINLISEADDALYCAKKAGRNQVAHARDA